MTTLAALPHWLNASVPKVFRAGRPQSFGSGCLHSAAPIQRDFVAWGRVG